MGRKNVVVALVASLAALTVLASVVGGAAVVLLPAAGHVDITAVGVSTFTSCRLRVLRVGLWVKIQSKMLSNHTEIILCNKIQNVNILHLYFFFFNFP